MATKSRKKLWLLLSIAGIAIIYFLWLQYRPVEIVAVHHSRDSNYSDVLVKNYPLTDQRKIDWWLKNKNMLKKKYGIPESASDGSYSVYFWLFGEGYKETDGNDRLCFDDMSPPLNCIDKEAVFSVSNSVNQGTIFTTYDGKYKLKKNGKIVKYERKFTARAVD